MEYPIVIEYFCGTENSIADALSPFKSTAIDNEVSSDLVKGVPLYACPVSKADHLDARTD